MFDEFLKNPLLLMLPPLLSVVVAFILSRAVELVPPFAVWWDNQAAENKLAIRGWAGLPLVFVLVAFAHLTGLWPLTLNLFSDWLLLIGVLVVSWLLYVASAEATYRVASTLNMIPRYSDEWQKAHK